MGNLQLNVKFFSVSLLFAFQLHLAASSEFYDLVARDIQGNEVSMDTFRGKALLIVNVASECGYTDQHYRELVELQNKLPSKDFAILAFPCNQFGGQESKRNSAILRFARNTYGVKFPMFGKIKVLGEASHPIYKFLIDKTRHQPTWNFNKYLLDRDGNVVKYWDHQVSPLQCLKRISKLITHAFDKDFQTFRVDGEL